MSGISGWLAQHQLERLQPLFVENDIDFDVLPELTEQDLAGLGISLGDRKRLLKAISQLADEADRTTAAPALERRQLTVLFCDLVGSTRLSTSLDPEDLRDIIRDYQDAAVAEVKTMGGLVSRFMGDGLMAYFGYPQSSELDAERSVRAALAIIASIRERPETSNLAVRIGIATGLVVIGDLVGVDTTEELAALGEAPNLAARLQALAEPNSVVISKTTLALTRNAFESVELGDQSLKGFEEPVAAFRIVGHARSAPIAQADEQFFGREAELRLLQERWQAAQQGEPSTLLISGEPGIGKSALIRALRRQLTGARTIIANCSPFRLGSPFFPFIAALRQASGIEEGDRDTDQADKVISLIQNEMGGDDRIVPAVLDLLELPVPEHYPEPATAPAQRRADSIAGLAALLKSMSLRGPILLVLEDAHWIDPSSLELLQTLVSETQNLPVLFVVSARPEFDSVRISGTRPTLLSISGLTDTASRMLIEKTAAGQPLATAVQDEIMAKTDGIPLFVEELTRSIIDSGMLVKVHDEYQFAEADHHLNIPESLQASLMSRIDQLGTAKEVIQIASVLGRDFEEELLIQLCPFGRDRVEAALGRIEQSVLAYKQTLEGRAIYTFKHALIQDVAYESQLREQRSAYHASTADLLIERGQDAPEIIAQHLTAGARPQEAIDYWYHAGEQAAARSAAREAVAHLDHGIALTRGQGSENAARELPLQVLRAGSLRNCEGMGAEATGVAYHRAEELCHQLDDHDQLIPILNGLYSYYMLRSEPAKSRRYAEQILAEATVQQDPHYLMVAHRALGALDFHNASYASSESHIKHALALYDFDEHGKDAFIYGSDHKQVGSCFLGLSLMALGRLSECTAVLAESVRHAEKLDHGHSICQSLAFQTMQYLLLGRPDLGLVSSGRIRKISAEFPMFQGVGLAWQAMVSFEHGEDPNTALQRMTEGVSKWWSTGSENYRYLAETVFARAYAAAGDMAAAWQYLETARDRVPISGEVWAEPEVYRVEGFLHQYFAAEPELARSAYQKALDLAEAQDSPFWRLRSALALATLERELGNLRLARELLLPERQLITETEFISGDMAAADALLEALAE